MFDKLINILESSSDIKNFVDGFYYKKSSFNRFSDNDLVFFLKDNNLIYTASLFEYLKEIIGNNFSKKCFFVYSTHRMVMINLISKKNVLLQITTYQSLQSAHSYEGSAMIEDLMSSFQCVIPIPKVTITKNLNRNLYLLIQLWIETRLIEFFPLIDKNITRNEAIHKFQFILKILGRFDDKVINDDIYNLDLDQLRKKSFQLLTNKLLLSNE